jgi:hypothetical protein
VAALGAPVEAAAPAPAAHAPIDRGTRILLVISLVLMLLAATALVIERLLP